MVLPEREIAVELGVAVDLGWALLQDVTVGVKTRQAPIVTAEGQVAIRERRRIEQAIRVTAVGTSTSLTDIYPQSAPAQTGDAGNFRTRKFRDPPVVLASCRRVEAISPLPAIPMNGG